MVLTLIWVYQTGNKAKLENVVMWVIICAVLFWASQFLFVWANNYMVESLRADQGQGYERGMLSVGDRKNLGGFQGAKGTMLSVFFELFPPIAGFLLVAVVRTKYMLKQSLTKDNLFSGCVDMFKSIKESFKNPDNA
jgi:hypothetical protein